MQTIEPPTNPPNLVPAFRAAQYVRMSTEHQQYSTENQADKIREYAIRRNIEIVRTYADEGKSGLRIYGRQALQQLIKDVETGNVDFQIILVYDVSRWGRFQDADESAYYEYICRRAGIQVAYCAEQFENDGSPVSTIVKGVKRAMAGEYSRELSAKVFAGQCRLIELGFRQGGPAGYGLRRVLIDQSGAIKSELARGEHKSLQTDRVILQPGPDNEVAVVNQIYRWFVDDNLAESEIAELLAGIEQLRDQGYDKKIIAEKTGLSQEYVHGVLYLLKNGEERLLTAVGSGRIPLHLAIVIAGAGSDDKTVQTALQDAYESGKLRGSQLIQARRVIERRRAQGRGMGGSMASRKPREDVTTSSLVRNYQREVERQKLLIRKSETAQRNLMFIVGALRQLLADENFTTLLRAEGLDTMPQYLADRVWARGSGT